jgi:glycosyltransferase involved in cell wall biosynthesis
MDKLRVVNISLSPSVLDSASVTAGRIAHYGRVTQEYIVVVPSNNDREVRLAENVVVYGVGGSNKLIKLFRVAQKMIELIKDGRCDVVAADQYFFGLLSVWLQKRYGVGFEVVALGFEKFTWLRKQVARFVLQRADSIRVNSPRLVQFIEEQFAIAGEKVHMVPIYVDVETIGLSGGRTDEEQVEFEKHIEWFAREYGGRFNFLSVNRLVPAKNISLQLRAIAKLKDRHPNIFLHVLGDGPLEAELQNEITSLGIASHVKLHGYTAGMKLGAVYSESDCFLLTSDTEGWGMVTIEALTAKLPIVMTDVGAAGEVIIDGESGIVVPVGNLSELVRVMKNVINDTDQRTCLVEGGQQALLSLPSFDEILELYKHSWEYTRREKKI